MAQGNGKGLSAAFVRTVREAGKYHDGGGLGLYLRVEAGGARFWVQRIAIHGRRRELGLGSFPVVPLADARQQALDNKRLIRAGGDPLAEKRKARETLTFADAVERYLGHKLAEFRNEKHRKQWRATLDTYATPVLGMKSVADIETRDVLRALEPIWAAKTETASRLRGRIEAVLSWATVAGHRTGDNPARWRGNLSELLAKPGKVAKAGNHPALALADVPRWWKALAVREGMAARALQFMALSAARSGEVRGMTWDELDFGPEGRATRATWVIPASRMKAGREHRIPLPGDAVALLESLPRVQGCPYVFPAARGGMLSDMALSMAMRRIQKADGGFLDARSGRPAVPHGLRSTFRDWTAEKGFDRDMAELQLAHNVGTEVERSYRRTDMLERRRAMLEAWACYLRGESMGADVIPMQPAAGGNVVPMRGAAE